MFNVYCYFTQIYEGKKNIYIYIYIFWHKRAIYYINISLTKTNITIVLILQENTSPHTERSN